MSFRTPEDLAAWRARTRERLLAARTAMPATARQWASAAIANHLIEQFMPSNPGLVGCYWPIRGEFDCLPVMRRVLALGGEVALPLVVRPRQPLAFRLWTPAAKMTIGAHGIPHPVEGPLVQPSMLLVPLLGFDGQGYRLGYGAGYYDRTLTALEPRPAAWGVGFEIGRLETVHPQPHDRAMDRIVTEAGFLG